MQGGSQDRGRTASVTRDVEGHMTPPAGQPAGDRAPGPARRRRRVRTVVTVVVAVCAALVAAVAGVYLIRSAGSSQPRAHGAAAGSAASKSALSGPAAVGPTPGQTPGQTAGPPPLSAAPLARQRVIYSYRGLTPPASLLRSTRAGQAAGVIFFGGNIASPSQLAAVIAELNRANASPQNPLRHYPLLLMTDQEGGVVRRLPGAPLLSEKQIGEGAPPAAPAEGPRPARGP